MTGARAGATAARPVGLVTGASSGIGRELARLLAADGHDLVLVARGEPALRALAEELGRDHAVAVHVVPFDLRDRGAPRALADRVEALGLAIDVLVNDAGVGLWGPFLENDLEAELDMIDLNVAALTALTKAFVRPMVARGRGRVLNVSSTAAFQPGPLMAVYYATKAYVLHLSLALAVELEGTGVTVTTLCPGPTRTGFAGAAKATGSKLFAGGRGADAAAVARAGYAGLLRGDPMVLPGARNKVLAFANRLVPRPLATRIVRGVNARAETG